MNRRVLVIDDEHSELIAQMIYSDVPGVVVQKASTVKDAEEILNEHCYDLIVLDVNLPGEEGTTVAARILEWDPTQPILMVTAYVGKHIDEDIMLLGVNKIDKLLLGNHPEQFTRQVAELLETRPCDGGRDAGQVSGYPRADRAADRTPDKPITLTSSIQAHARAVRF